MKTEPLKIITHRSQKASGSSGIYFSQSENDSFHECEQMKFHFSLELLSTVSCGVDDID